MTQDGEDSDRPSPGYRCTTCGEQHEGIALAWGANSPDALRVIPRAEWRRRVRLNTDQCVLDRTQYFVRGCLDLRIHGTTEVFRHLVWVELPRSAFRDVRSVWRELRGRPFPPYAGRLASILPYRESTFGLSVTITWAGAGMRPHVLVASDEHAVGGEQHSGIGMQRAQDLASDYRHRHRSGAVGTLSE